MLSVTSQKKIKTCKSKYYFIILKIDESSKDVLGYVYCEDGHRKEKRKR